MTERFYGIDVADDVETLAEGEVRDDGTIFWRVVQIAVGEGI